MKIAPLQAYRELNYPTMQAATALPTLLGALPRRWERSRGLSTLLGLGLLTRTLAAQVDDAAAPTPAAPAAALVPSPSDRAAGKPDAAQQIARATTLVAPVLAEALERDGRGSIGCVAINPPTFIPEDEAIELIRAELAAAGLDVEEGVTLADIVAPPSGIPNEEEFEEEDGTADGGVRFGPGGRKPKLGPREYEFDLADAKRAIYIEYLSHRDHNEWMGHSMSTVSSFDFPETVDRVKGALQKRTAGAPAVFGLFFDPLACPRVLRPDLNGLSPEQARLARAQHARAEAEARESIDATAHERLRKQVRHFVAYLRKEGLIGAAAQSR